MNLPLINICPFPYEVWSTREASQNEMMEHYKKNGYFSNMINDELKYIVTNPLDSAKHIATVAVDNRLSQLINDALDNDKNYRSLRNTMPSQTPAELFKYQKEYPHYNPLKVDTEINNVGCTLSEGQFLFHGGRWLGSHTNEFVTERPLSTTFCPQIALRNAEFRGKAYDNDRIDILVLKVENPVTNVFAFRRKGTNMGHENEILFASGAKLHLYQEHLIRENYKVEKASQGLDIIEKEVPIYVLEVGIS